VRSLRILSLLGAVVMVAGLSLASVASAHSGHRGGPEQYRAKLAPVPHDPAADGGSNASGRSGLSLRGTRLDVRLKARGLSPNLPHAMHIHGKDNPEVAQCPRADRRAGGVSDRLIETVDGLVDYGPIQVSFTTRGDTSPDSGLALDRFASAKRNGKLSYRRTVTLPREVAENLGDKHIVIHGHDIDQDGGYDPGPITALGAPLEAELPVACGEIVRKR
jgi:hypothetical protein